jgi:hypothetical protein
MAAEDAVAARARLLENICTGLYAHSWRLLEAYVFLGAHVCHPVLQVSPGAAS